MSNGHPRSSDIEYDHNKHVLSMLLKDAIKRISNPGIVCGPYDMLHDYTQESMSHMHEAGRKYGLEKEQEYMSKVFGVNHE